MRIFATPNFNFIRWRWHAIVLSVALVGFGLSHIIRNGLNFGIDFSGGTALLVQFKQPTGEQAVRTALTSVASEIIVQRSGRESENKILVRLPQLVEVEQSTNITQGRAKVETALRAANVGDFEIISTDIVGPVIGEDLRNKGVYATIAALLGIMTYIAFRFRLSFGVGAAVASVHDVLVTLSILTLTGHELTLNVVAALLTLTGYGVNDQIVVFDRVRENLRSKSRQSMDELINLSVNQTLPRTVITAGVTFLSVLALYLFGGEVLEGFAFTMLVGIITSTYSTVYIASAVAVVLSPQRAQTAPLAAKRRP